MFLFPILQCTCFFLAIGDNPKSLKLGIVNEEVANWQDCYNTSLVTAHLHDYECNLTKISCRYLKEIPPEYAIQVLYPHQPHPLPHFPVRPTLPRIDRVPCSLRLRHLRPLSHW